LQFFRFACNQICVLDAVLLNEKLHPGCVLQLLRFFEIEGNDLESTGAILAIEFCQERSLVVVIRAPVRTEPYYTLRTGRVDQMRRSDHSFEMTER
jgi:hypothetical protein